MEIEKSPYQTTCSEPLIEGQFLMNNLHTRLLIYPDSIYFQNDKLQCSYTINFDFSYDIQREGNGWLLSIFCPQTFRFFSIFQLENWDRLLLQIMKRRGFHDLYKGVCKIGKGNFASVYLAERVKDGKSFAVKAFQKQAAFKPTNGKQGLQNQINILRRLNNPNIIHLEGVYETDNSIYLVMQFIQGKNLGELLDQQKSLFPSARKKIMKGIMSGLAEMQRKNVVHRDIKPENIMINSLGEAKIVDFGLSTDTQVSNYLYVRCGTPGFVAPEIITIRDNDSVKMSSISDVFSAGAVFYQMIFGKALFDGKNNTDVLERNRRCLITIPTSSDLASFQELVLLRRMLDIFPETRIMASQAIRSSFFNEKRAPLQQLHSGQQKNLLPLKNQLAVVQPPRRVKRSQNWGN